MNKKENFFDNDLPIHKLSDDLLGRDTFVDSLIKTIDEISLHEKFIIGIDGEWGSGKTSCVNLLSINLLSRNDIEYLYVNAWSHNGDLDSILIDIFDQLESIIYDDRSRSLRRRKCAGTKKRIKLEKKLEKVGVFIDGAPSAVTDLVNSSSAVKVGGFGINILRNILANTNNFKKINNNLRKKIREKKIVVVIDDIDRLKPDSVIEILSSLSTVAAFNGFVYLLPFDSKILDSCISESFSGSDYRRYFFDKIIQLCIKIPKIPYSTMSRLFRVEYENLLRRFNYDNDEIIREFNIIEYCGAIKILDTPRDVKRIFISAYYVSCTISNYVNVADIVLLEIIRIKCPELHNLIYNNMDLFVRTDNSRIVKDRDDKTKRLNNLFKIYPNFKLILRNLFRYMSEYEKGSIVELNSYGDKSVSNPANFNYYYTFLMEKELNEITIIEDIFSEPCDVESICLSMKELDRDGYLVLLDYARGHLDNFTNIDILHAMLDCVFKNNNSKTNALSLDYADMTLFLFDEIINKMNDKFGVYTDILRYAKQHKYIMLIPLLIRQVVLYSEGGKDAVAGIGFILSSDEKKKYLDESAIPTIKWAFNSGLVPICRDINNNSSLYYYYGFDYLGEKFVKKYTKKTIKTSGELINFFLLFIGTWSTLGEYDYHYGVINEATFSIICKYIDAEYAYALLRNSDMYGRLWDSDDIVTDFNFHGDGSDELKRTFAVGHEGEKLYIELAKQFMYFYRKRRDNKDNGE